eukprot:366122-Chlamydomonas_euryale.AAC.15
MPAARGHAGAHRVLTGQLRGDGEGASPQASPRPHPLQLSVGVGSGQWEQQLRGRAHAAPTWRPLHSTAGTLRPSAHARPTVAPSLSLAGRVDHQRGTRAAGDYGLADQA